MKNENKIIFTDGDEYKKFPQTPSPEIRYEGVFLTPEEIKNYFRNILKRH